jgi:hypothetical protein
MARRVRLVLALLPLLAGLAFGGWYLYQRSQRSSGDSDRVREGPNRKLVVLVVFDQMRGDYLARWAAQFGPDGFERMKKDGIWYSDCHIPYGCTTTGPGHASISTGVPPSVHGIVDNDWYERHAAARVYCVQPLRPYERVPPMAGAGGFSPERLLAETVCDRLHAATGGKGRVVSLSLKDRTAVLMAGRKPAAVYCFDSRDGLFHTSAYYRESVHHWVEEFNNSRKVNAWIGRDWTRLQEGLDYTALAGPDDAANEGYGFAQKRVFPHPMGDEPRPGPRYYGAVEASPFGNELLLELAKKALTGEKLGRGKAADLLCVSFSSNDLVGHQWGPDSWEVLDITLRSDRLIAEFLRFLDETVGKDRYVMVVTADHGVCPIPEQKRVPGAERRPLRVMLPQLAAALDDTFGKSPAGPAGWFDATDADWARFWPWLHLNRAAIQARGLDPDQVADYAAQWLGNRPFMLTAFTRRHLETGTLPPASPGLEKEVWAMLGKVKLTYRADRCGDVYAIPKAGTLVGDYTEGTSHGTPHPYDTHVPLLVSGAGVPAAGKREVPVSSLAAAPILAWALGVEPPAGAVEKLPVEFAAVPK